MHCLSELSVYRRWLLADLGESVGGLFHCTADLNGFGPVLSGMTEVYLAGDV